MSDDIRIPSGVGTMSKALVEGTVHKYDWVQIGGAIKHPDVKYLTYLKISKIWE